MINNPGPHVSPSHPSESLALACPLGEETCPLLDEVQRLRGENEELRALVQTDPLTGLYNFRYFSQTLSHELERSTRGQGPTGLIMLDLDHFKQVNDQWGHETGNQVLQRLAKILRTWVRRVDIPCRYGGEEFTVILPATGLRQALFVAERLRTQTEQERIVVDQQEIQVTISLGIAVCHPQERLTPEALVEKADAWLYQAKEQGRNRVGHPPLERWGTGSEVSREEKSVLLD